MKKYEYKTALVSCCSIYGGGIQQQIFEEQLNAFGADGWEIIYFAPDMNGVKLLMKREYSN